MDKFGFIAVMIILIVGGGVYVYYEYSHSKIIDTPVNNTSLNLTDITIANWNMQIFGDSKASDPVMMSKYASHIDDYDIIFIQEIRDEDGSSFVALCNLLPNYNCNISSRAGRSTSKEQYGVVYKKGISIIEFVDFNPDTSLDRWERAPIYVTFNASGRIVEVYNIHTKPDDVKNELLNLQGIVKNTGNQIVIGDLNADCNYYDNAANHEFISWTWVIGDEIDTTSSDTDCAYDRIIMNYPYKSYGVDTTTTNMSDHYIVYVRI